MSTTGMASRIRDAINTGAVDYERPTTYLAQFVTLRHFIREVFYEIERVGMEWRHAKRIAGHLAKSPFDKHRLDQVNEYVEQLDTYRKELRGRKQRLGRMVIDLAPFIDAVTTMDERLDLLNCNVADRSRLPSEDTDLVHLIAVYCVEDSAAHRRDEFNSRPLHSAVNAEIHRVMFDTPKGRAASSRMFDEAFAPSGPLYGVPTYRMKQDGTVQRQGPALVVHDASGSRVVERGPGR